MEDGGVGHRVEGEWRRRAWGSGRMVASSVGKREDGGVGRGEEGGRQRSMDNGGGGRMSMETGGHRGRTGADHSRGRPASQAENDGVGRHGGRTAASGAPSLSARVPWIGCGSRRGWGKENGDREEEEWKK